MSELAIKDAFVQVIQGNIIFGNFEEIYEQALQLKEYIESVEVTDESMKATKKMLAAVSKKVKELEDNRINVKKEILSPYETFEEQVKLITNTVKEAEQGVRKKVKELEERERDEKEIVVTELFNKRKPLYPILSFFEIHDFLTSKHLNKSTSLKSIEEEMATWFETKKRDIEMIEGLEYSGEVLTEYMDTKDVSLAVSIVKERLERQKAIEQTRKQVVPLKQSFTFTIFTEKDANFVELFLKQNDIKFEKGTQ